MDWLDVELGFSRTLVDKQNEGKLIIPECKCITPCGYIDISHVVVKEKEEEVAINVKSKNSLLDPGKKK